jgi:hypothetical protein
VHVPPYWAKAEHRFDPEGRHRVVAWRWSDRSEAEAAAAARARVAEIVAALAEGRRPDRTEYADRPLREERLASVPAVGRELHAIVTRNAQGCEVLNAARVPFLDLDFAHLPGPGLVAWLRRLLGGAAAPSEEARALAHVERWARRLPGARMRVYRTRSGLRVLLLDRTLDPRGREARELLRSLGADPLYRRLCEVQGSFRARLTPKPRRIGMKRIPHEWPTSDPRQLQDRARWIEEYDARRRGFAVCRLLAELGAGPIHPEAARILELHDRAVLREEGTPLA